LRKEIFDQDDFGNIFLISILFCRLYNPQLKAMQAASFCCQYGLKVASPSTADITCIVTTTSYGKFNISYQQIISSASLICFFRLKNVKNQIIREEIFN